MFAKILKMAHVAFQVEMEFEMLHVNCGTTVNGAAVRRTYLTYTHVNN